MSAHPEPTPLTSYAVPRPGPTRNGYFAYNRLVNAGLRLVDAGARLLRPRHHKPAVPAEAPRRILLTNGAHLGDVVLSLTLLPLIKRAFPQADIGLLVGSWSTAVVRNHPDIRWTHTIDHWRLNRSRSSLIAKLMRYAGTRRRALAEIRRVGYDIAVDLYFYFPNSASILYLASIPRRIGYTSAGLGPLFTDPVEWVAGNQSVAQYHLDLLNRLTGRHDVLSDRDQPLLRFATKESATPAELTHRYVVLHVGTGGATKEWPLDKWRALAAALTASGQALVFTGAGHAERAAIEQVTHDLPACCNLCDRLDWHGFVDVIAGADLLIGLDSVAGHVAAAVGTPAIVISNGVHQPALWRPRSSRGIVLSQPVGCSPCYLKRGCGAMACIRDLPPATVVEQASRILQEFSSIAAQEFR